MEEGREEEGREEEGREESRGGKSVAIKSCEYLVANIQDVYSIQLVGYNIQSKHWNGLVS